MKLYGHPMSNHSLRVQALLEEFGITYEFQLIDFDKQENHTPGYLELNPNGMVPVINDDGYILWESHAILRYLCDKTGRDDWYPKDYKKRVQVDKWLDWCHTRINPEAVAIVFNSFRNQGADRETKINVAKEKLKNILPIIEGVFDEQAYLCGETISIADLSLLTSLFYLHMCNAGLKAYPATQKWLDNNITRPSVAKVIPEQATK